MCVVLLFVRFVIRFRLMFVWVFVEKCGSVMVGVMRLKLLCSVISRMLNRFVWVLCVLLLYR